MGLAALENLLKVSMGLNAASIGSAAIARAVQGRLSACKVGDLHGYQELLRVSATELQALIEAVVVPETWFFRDRHAFTALTRMVHDEWLPAHPDGVLSLLSLPCSTGEEPYSMAMALFDARVPGNRFRVDAVDISARHLAQGSNLDARLRHVEAEVRDALVLGDVEVGASHEQSVLRDRKSVV